MKKGMLIMLALGMTLAISSCKKESAACTKAKQNEEKYFKIMQESQDKYYQTNSDYDKIKYNQAKQNYNESKKSVHNSCK